MKVYILLNCNAEGSNFLGVYSSKRLAKEAQEEYNERVRKVNEQYPSLREWDEANEIQEIELDEKPSEIL
jgi:hypothetical protein